MARSDPTTADCTRWQEHWCPDCQHVVELDDGCCSCGKVLDWAAFEAADKRLAELNADPDAALYAEADYRYDLGRAF
jgi:hypothetical protein